MAKKYVIPITNGVGSENIVNGTYDATVESIGYLASSIDPSSITVTDNVDTYSFEVSAEGTLNLHVTETGEAGGTPITGATFYRCDSSGTTTYGEAITSLDTGIATFNYVPYSATDTAPVIYFKQTASDGEHNFDTTVYSVTLDTATYTKEIINAPAETKTIELTDKNYSGLKIETATITLDEN